MVQKPQATETRLILGISIVNYYSLNSVELLLSSLSSFTQGIATQICIVDNSLDSEAVETTGLQRLADFYTTENFVIDVTRSPTNLGYGAGNNLAASKLLEKGSDLIWVLNPDILISGHKTDFLNEIRESKSDIWATSTVENGTKGSGLGTLNTWSGKGSTSIRQNFGRRFLSFDYPAGHSIIFKREAWLKLGGFDERYFLFMEEADLTLRAHKLGISMGTLASVTVDHNQGLTTGSSKDIANKSLTAFREATKSRVIFFRRFYPLRLPFFLFSRFVYAALVRVKGNSVGSKAVVDGLISGIKHRNRTARSN